MLFQRYQSYYDRVSFFAKIFQHHKSLAPSKSIPQKSKHDFKEKYSCIRVGLLKPMHIKYILTKNNWFLLYASVLE